MPTTSKGMQKAGELLQEAKGAMAEKTSQVASAVKEKAGDIKRSAEPNKPIGQKAQEAWEGTKIKASEIKGAAAEKIEKVAGNIKESSQQIKREATPDKSLSEKAQETWETTKEKVGNGVEQAKRGMAKAGEKVASTIESGSKKAAK